MSDVEAKPRESMSNSAIKTIEDVTDATESVMMEPALMREQAELETSQHATIDELAELTAQRKAMMAKRTRRASRRGQS